MCDASRYHHQQPVQSQISNVSFVASHSECPEQSVAVTEEERLAVAVVPTHEPQQVHRLVLI